MEYKGLTLDKFQEDSISSIDQNHSVVVSAPTGLGKTLIADYIINKYLKKGIKVIYTAPIKALSNQKYQEFSKDYGEENIGLLTGDIVKNSKAPILIMTTEIYRNMALTNDSFLSDISYVIFDEIHFINDLERGYVWEESIIFSKPNVRFLCLSATIPNAQEFADWISTIKKHKVDVIKHDKRVVPLHRNFYDTELGITTLKQIKDVKDIPEYGYSHGRLRIKRQFIKKPSHVELIREIRNKLPCFFFTFSRERCQKNASELMKSNLFEPNYKITTFIRKKLAGTIPDINRLKSTQILRQTLAYGIGFHHAGLIPIIKELVEELFSLGMIKVLYTTETFAVGINMPAKTVCFDSLRKYDGISFRFLNSKEYFQIAGRAGRRGIDKEGFVYSMIDRRDFNYARLKDMTSADTEPIRSQFRLSINTVLNLIKLHNNEEINEILSNNFYTFQKYKGNKKRSLIYNTFNNTKKKLIKLEYIKDDNILTEKGEFSSKIYADEILMGELFATKFFENINEYQILMILACLSYEAKEKNAFFKKFSSKLIKNLKEKINKNIYLNKEKRFRNLDNLATLIHPVYYGANIFDVMKNTNLLEGDLFRFYHQILDKLGQIRKATKNQEFIKLLKNCQRIIRDSMKDIDVV